MDPFEAFITLHPVRSSVVLLEVDLLAVIAEMFFFQPEAAQLTQVLVTVCLHFEYLYLLQLADLIFTLALLLLDCWLAYDDGEGVGDRLPQLLLRGRDALLLRGGFERLLFHLCDLGRHCRRL